MATKLQKKAFKIVMKEDEPTSVAMVKAGYAPLTAKDPWKLTRSRGWAELTDKHLPDKLLIQVHREGLAATEIRNKLLEDGRIAPAEVPDYEIRHKYLDSAYKIKGSYAPEKHLSQNVSIGILLDELQKLD